MSNFFNDTVAKQISRGEVFFGSMYGITDEGDDVNLRITTGANNCSLSIDIQSEESLLIFLYENPTTATGGSAVLLYNMNRESSSTINTDVYTGSTLVGGTSLGSYYLVNGRLPVNTFFNKESPIILKPNEDYRLSIVNDGRAQAYWSITMFLRENA